MNYDTMEAGPEMDLLIGTLVMGWRVGELYSDEDRKECPNLSQSHYYDADGSLGLYAVFDFRPSVKVSHAWQVAERLASRPWSCCDLSIDADSMMVDAAGRHTAYRCLTPSMDASMVDMLTTKPVVAWGRTMPEAICRCALAALKSTHKES